MRAGDREELLRMVAEMPGASGYEDQGPPPAGGDARPEPGEGWPLAAMLDEDDEQLVAAVVAALARLARAARAAAPEPEAPPGALRRMLDGAELMMRAEILRGEGGRLPKLLPSFAFLVALPIVGRAEALSVSRRVAALQNSGADG